MFGMCDEGNLPRRKCGRWCLHRLGEPQLGNALVDVAEQSQALIAREVFYRHGRHLCAPQGLQGLGCTRHGLAVLAPNDQVLIIPQHGPSQILQRSCGFWRLGGGGGAGV